jgi:carbon monoxide dehydrogenase subunit G
VKLEHSFTVPADLDTVWQAVLDPERVAPCMPGATLTEVDGDAFTGSVKVKLGPISLLYKGSGEFLSKDPEARTVVIKASGKDARGNGTAAATVTVALTADGSSTRGAVVTDLSITGKPAQFGRGLISEVGGKILDTFATCLASKLGPEEAQEAPALSVVKEPSPSAAGSGAGSAAGSASASASEKAAADRVEAVATGRKAGEATAAATKPRLAAAPEPETEAIDLLSVAGPSVLKRVAPLVVVVGAVLAFIALRRRR